MFFGLNSMNVHVLIAIDRARSTMTTIVQRTNQRRSLINVKFVVTTLLISILVSVSWTVYPFIMGHPKYVMGFEGYYWTLDYTDSTRSAQYYIFVLLCLQYSTPLIAIVLIYLEILRRVNKQSHTTASTLKTRRITAISAASAMAFILGWTPYAIMAVLIFTGNSPGLTFVFFANAAAKLSCLYNSMLFYTSSRMSKRNQQRKDKNKPGDGENSSSNAGLGSGGNTGPSFFRKNSTHSCTRKISSNQKPPKRSVAAIKSSPQVKNEAAVKSGPAFSTSDLSNSATSSGQNRSSSGASSSRYCKPVTELALEQTRVCADVTVEHVAQTEV